jgi:hypothetical protein
MRVTFTGSREYPRPELVDNFVVALARKYPESVVISGGRGVVDQHAEVSALSCGLEVISYRPIELEGGGFAACVWVAPPGGTLEKTELVLGTKLKSFAQACFYRDELMVKAGERVVGFWDLSSKGTAHTLSIAKGMGKPRTVYGPTGNGLHDIEVDRAVQVALEP